MPKKRPVKASPVARRLEELRIERGVDRKQLAGAVGKTRQTVDSALIGKSNMLLPDAETMAKKLGAAIEVVEHQNPSDDFRRALDANKDLDPLLRDEIWAMFERAKMRALRMRPKKREAG
jgi:transcriptional regulator with XRE-family HTH domain